MFEWAKNLFRRRPTAAALREQNEKVEAEIAGRLLSNLQRELQEQNGGAPNANFWSSIVDPTEPIWDTTDFWLPLGFPQSVPWTLNNQKRGEVLPVYINEYGLKVIRDWSRKMCAFNEFAINALENRISYIVGKGFQYKAVPAKSKGPAFDNLDAQGSNALCQQVQAVIDEFIDRNNWGEREQEAVRRCDRDGEALLRFFHVGGGRTVVRFIEPEHVTAQNGEQIHRMYGVITDPEDVEDVRAYSIVLNPNDGWYTTDIPAEEVLHIKLNTDSDAKRGLPTLFPVRKNLDRADKLLRNMSTLAQVQATFAVIRKHKQFGQSSVQTYQQNQSDLNLTLPVTGRALQMQQLFPGSILDTSDKTEYEFPSAKIDASSLVAVLQAELRAVAARLCMPEYMLTVDASNANYASTLVAAAPAVKNFERLQSLFARRFGDGQYPATGLKHAGAMWRVIANAVEYGRLPREVLTEVEIQVEGPSLVAVDKSAETNRAKTLYEAGVLSPPTWAKWEGLEYEQEQAQGAQPRGNSLPGKGEFPPGGGGEESPGSSPPGSAGGAASLLGISEAAKMVFGRCIDNGRVVDRSHCAGQDQSGGKSAGGSEDVYKKHLLGLPKGEIIRRWKLLRQGCASKPGDPDCATAEKILGDVARQLGIVPPSVGKTKPAKSAKRPAKHTPVKPAASSTHPGAAYGAEVKVKMVEERAAPRDDKGRVVPVELKTKLTKQETGNVAEAVIRAYLRDMEGIEDASALNAGRKNEAIDLIGDSMAPEVKGGLASNSASAQQWRITFSMELSEKEQKKYDAMSEEDKKAYREKKQRACLQRKFRKLAEVSKQRGRQIRPVTYTGILNPDTQLVDIYRTDGYHQRIGWNDPKAKFVATVRYDHAD